ncbi:claudin-19-like [Anolis sagrei]|uniref:claudin-19-like n=1 Tax=Anolis sagrei TaxID=38937 RepID=UPI0035224664
MANSAMVLGLVVAPMGWVLMLAATVTPQWREFPRKPGFPQDVSFSDGLWESCVEVTSLQGKACHAIPEEMAISWPIQMVRALAVVSVLVGFLGYVLSHVGARWWSGSPNYSLTGASGLLLLLSGAMYLCGTSYMAYRALADLTKAQVPPENRYHLGTCLYLGWSGGTAEVFAGLCLASSFHKKDGHRLRSLHVPYRVDY